MKRFSQTLRRRMADFRDNENGSGAIELVLMVPVLSAITFGMVTYTGAFKAKTHATRAATVVADMVSRETNPITPNYMNGISGLLDDLVSSDETPEYRLTVFTWNQREEEYRVRWSKEDGSRGVLNHDKLNMVADRLPKMRGGQRAILLETWVDYQPMTNIGLENGATFENFIVAAPRFVPQLCWAEGEDADPTTARC